MLVSAERTATNTYTVEIKIEAEAFKAAVEKAYLKERKSIQIPGFRKGKAPLHMIRKLYGEKVFFDDALEDLFPEEAGKAYEEAKIEAVDSPKDLDVKSWSIEEGAHYTFTVTVKPEVTLKQYKGLEAEKAEVNVTDEDVENEIKDMLEKCSRLVDVDSRAVEDGDITVIDFEGFVDGVAFEGGKGEKYELTIGSGSFIPGFEEQIIGHSIGEEFDVNVTFPEEYTEELKGKAAVFKIKLHEIKVKELPELDDEFAKDMGEYETVDELKKGVRDEITERKTKEAEQAFEEKVMNALAENVEAEIPDVMVDNRAEYNVRAFASSVENQGIAFQTYLAYMGMDYDSFKDSMKDRALNDVKLDLAVEKIIEAEAIEATEEEIEKAYADMAENYNIDVDTVKKSVNAETITDDIKRKKAIKLVIDEAK